MYDHAELAAFLFRQRLLGYSSDFWLSLCSLLFCNAWLS